MTTRVIYQGPSPEVYVGNTEFPRNEAVEVEDDLAAQLVVSCFEYHEDDAPPAEDSADDDAGDAGDPQGEEE